MLRTWLLIVLSFSASLAFGCECTRGIGKNFLNRIDKFDSVVLGTLYKEDSSIEKAYLIIEKVYKGSIKNDTIKLVVGSLCDSWLDNKTGERLVLGIKKFIYSDATDAFTIPGCVTSSLIINDRNKVLALKNGLPTRKLKIGWLSNKMRLDRLEQRIKNKI